MHLKRSVITRMALVLMLAGILMIGLWPTRKEQVAARSHSNHVQTNAQLNPAPGDDQGKIVFEVEGEIYIMNADGREQTRLTDGNPKVEDKQPALSPDGTRIAFSSDRDGRSFNLYAMDIDGQNVQQLTNNNAHESSPAWSPDGTRIAFVLGPDLTVGGVAYVSSCRSEIYVMNADGSGWWTHLTNAEGGTDPAWSPDGREIAFSSSRTGNYEIYVMAVDGNRTRVAQLTSTLRQEGDPAWSPDGQFIAYGADYEERLIPWCGFIHTPDPPNPPIRQMGGASVYVMRADGTDAVKLTTSGAASDPVWSLDGTRIAFILLQGEYSQIHIVDREGKNESSVTHDESFKSSPAWAPSRTP